MLIYLIVFETIKKKSYFSPGNISHVTFQQWTSQLGQNILPELLAGKNTQRKALDGLLFWQISTKMNIYNGEKPHHISVSTLAWKSIVHGE